MKSGSRLIAVVVAISPLLLCGCVSLWTGGKEQVRQGASSSLVDFLYPGGEQPPEPDHRLPYLQPPLRVGIAFVPSQNSTDISAAQKQALLEHVADAFRGRDFVESIETIPDTYMRSARGLLGMKQVASLYGVEVMALVSYDQISFSGERDSALLYWTIVGALVVKGSTNEVQTMVDTAVFDVPTAKLLFRAPGTHTQQRNATLVDNARDLRDLRSKGFLGATDDMIVNLDQELEQFREAARSGQRAQVEWKNESDGGGGGFALPLILLLFAAARGTPGHLRRRRQPHGIR
jgi:rhombotail lipoprotein